jgi:cytidylate kinase
VAAVAVTLVTISAAYGAGGSRIAPALARRLGVPFLGRPAVPGLDSADDDDGDELWACDEGGSAGALLSRIASVAVAWGTPAGMTADELLPDQRRRRELEAEVDAFAEGGEGVILGRGAVVLLHGDPRALHVLLDGPPEARRLRAMEIEGIDRRTAERRRARVDRFRRAYLEDLYGFDVRAPGMIQLALEATALPLFGCVEAIAAAVRARVVSRGSGTPGYSPTMATTRAGPALPPSTRSGKQLTVKPVGGSASRPTSRSICEYASPT